MCYVIMCHLSSFPCLSWVLKTVIPWNLRVCLHLWPWFSTMKVQMHGTIEQKLANSWCNMKPSNSWSMDHHDSSFFLFCSFLCRLRRQRTQIKSPKRWGDVISDSLTATVSSSTISPKFSIRNASDSWQTSQCSEILHLPGNRRLPKWGFRGREFVDRCLKISRDFRPLAKTV